MKTSELREKSDEELYQLIRERRDDMMHFRLQMATGVVDNVRSSREARKDVARIKTLLNERKRAGESAGGDGN